MCNKEENKYRTNLIIAGYFNKTKTNIFYNNVVHHAPAVAINLYSNALLQKLSGSKEAVILTVNEPVKPQKLVKYFSSYLTHILYERIQNSFKFVFFRIFVVLNLK